MSNEPRNLNVDKTRRKFYDDLQDEKWTPFSKTKKRLMRDIFLFSAILGHASKTKLPLEKKDAAINLSAFNEEEKWIFKSLIIDSDGIEALWDERALYNQVEEYANGGLEELYYIIYDNQINPELALEEIIRNYIVENKIIIQEKD